MLNYGTFSGEGQLFISTGEVQRGTFVNSKLAGPGEIWLPDGTYMAGHFFQGLLEGRGVLTLGGSGTTSYVGSFQRGQLHGQGVLRRGNVQYEGSFAAGKVVGPCRVTYPNGTIYEGHISPAYLRHGAGKVIFPAYAARQQQQQQQQRSSEDSKEHQQQQYQHIPSSQSFSYLTLPIPVKVPGVPDSWSLTSPVPPVPIPPPPLKLRGLEAVQLAASQTPSPVQIVNVAGRGNRGQAQGTGRGRKNSGPDSSSYPFEAGMTVVPTVGGSDGVSNTAQAIIDVSTMGSGGSGGGGAGGGAVGAGAVSPVTNGGVSDKPTSTTSAGSVLALLEQDLLMYDGEWRNDLPCGTGRAILVGGDEYRGEWVAGQRHGKGRLVSASSDSAETDGSWLHGLLHGHGIVRYKDGSTFEGEWRHGVAQNVSDSLGLASIRVTTQRVAQLVRELDDEKIKIDPKILCKLCQRKEMNILFLECGHLLFCEDCALGMAKCAVCHSKVDRQIPIFRATG